MATWSTMEEYGDILNKPRVCLRRVDVPVTRWVPSSQFDTDILKQIGWSFLAVLPDELEDFQQRAKAAGYWLETIVTVIPDAKVRWGIHGTKLNPL